MKKGKAITVLSLIGILLVALLLATFLRFSVGIKDYNSFLGTVKLDFDMTGGTRYTYSLDADENVDNIDEVVDTINSRMQKLGYETYILETSKDTDETVKDYDIKVTVLPSVNVENDIATVFEYGELELYVGKEANPTDRVLSGEKVIVDAYHNDIIKDGANTYYPVSIKFTDKAYSEIKKVMDDNNGSCYIALKLDGKAIEGFDGSNSVNSTSIVNKQLTIYPYNEATANSYVLRLSSGGLNYKYNQSNVETIDAVFGSNSDVYAIIIVVAIIVIVSAVFSYLFKGFGLVSFISLLAFILGEVALLVAIPNVTVSFNGVIGIILSLILAIDGLILTINRVKEEFNSGKTVKAAINTGYRRAFRPILNTHIVTLILSLLAFAILGGAVKSFAITVSVGIVLSFIATALLSRLLVIAFIPLLAKPEVFFNFQKTEE